MKKKEWLALFAIVLIAAIFRLWQLDTYPPGLYPDEAMNGNNALQALATGNFKIFYPENNGREGLFINIQALSIYFFGNTAWSLRIVSALFGTLTVIGLYLLVREMINFEVAATSAFLLATCFWHVVFSRIGFRAIMSPFIFIWGLYFFWLGLSSLRSKFFILSGLLWGIGYYTYISFRIMPLAAAVTLYAFLTFLRTEYKNGQLKQKFKGLFKGMGLMLLSATIVTTPFIWHTIKHPEDFMGRAGQISVFTDPNPLLAILKNTILTLGMFNFYGDTNWRHNISGHPQLNIVTGIFFAIGLIATFYKLYTIKKRQGHLCIVHITFLSWLILGLLPAILSNEGIPHALRAIIVTPVACIFAAQGLWWLHELLQVPYRPGQNHLVNSGQPNNSLCIGRKKAVLMPTAAIVSLLFVIGISDYFKYFVRWTPLPEVALYFEQRSSFIAEELKSMPKILKKYVLVNSDGVLVNGIPMPAQSVMYLTDTWTMEKQTAKNIYYLTVQDFSLGNYECDSVIISLIPINPPINPKTCLQKSPPST